MALNGSQGLRFPHGVAAYTPYSKTYLTETQEINRPDLPFAGNTFVFVCDTGNHRIVMLNMT